MRDQISRMPMDNKINISESLTTHAVWQNAIKCDPLDKKIFPEQEHSRRKKSGISITDLIARGSQSMPTCAKCGESGHLTYQCRNFLTIKGGKVVKSDSTLVPEKKGFASEEEKAKSSKIGVSGPEEKKEHHHHHHHHHEHHEHRKHDSKSGHPAGKSETKGVEERPKERIRSRSRSVEKSKKKQEEKVETISEEEFRKMMESEYTKYAAGSESHQVGQSSPAKCP